jgi:hypothetical protein
MKNCYNEIDTYITLLSDGKHIIILGKHYVGSPIIAWKYDIIIGPKRIIAKYKKELFFSKRPDDDWKPKVIYL